jgi:hypothetical protein
MAEGDEMNTPTIKPGNEFEHVLILQVGEDEFAEAVYGRDGFFRFGYDEPPIDDAEEWLPLPRRGQIYLEESEIDEQSAFEEAFGGLPKCLERGDESTGFAAYLITKTEYAESFSSYQDEFCDGWRAWKLRADLENKRKVTP